MTEPTRNLPDTIAIAAREWADTIPENLLRGALAYQRACAVADARVIELLTEGDAKEKAEIVDLLRRAREYADSSAEAEREAVEEYCDPDYPEDIDAECSAPGLVTDIDALLARLVPCHHGCGQGQHERILDCPVVVASLGAGCP
jgi:hypothetical protein